MNNPQTFATATQLPAVMLGLTSALDQADGDVERAAENGGAFEDWAEAEPEVRACILLSAAFGAGRGPAPTMGDDMHPHVAGYVEDLHAYAAAFTADQSEAFHGPAFPAMPLPGQAGALASSLGFDRDDLEISFGVALVLLAASRAAAAA
jgi:hypothetical protein